MDYETLWLRVEAMVLGLMEQHGETRNSIGPKLGLGRNHLRRYILSEDQRRGRRKVTPAFDLAFQVAEHFGVRPSSLLAPFARDAPEVLLQLLPCPSSKNVDVAMLRHIQSLHGRIVSSPGVSASSRQERLHTSSELQQAYAELESLEQRRHYEPEDVAASCRAALKNESRKRASRLDAVESIRLIGLAGLWASVQRRRDRLDEASVAFQSTIALSRETGDPGLYATQLKRAAYVFIALDTADLAMSVLREASEIFRADRNDIDAACTLVDRAVAAMHADRLAVAERLYRAGLDLLSVEDTNSFYKAVAAQGLSKCRDLQGDVRGALRFLTIAVEEADPRCTQLRAALLYTAANIERRLQHFDKAEFKYWEALAICEESDDADSAIRVCIDLAVCLIKAGRQQRLATVRETLARFLPKLRNERTLQRECELLLSELWRESVTVEELNRVARQLEGGAVAATSE